MKKKAYLTPQANIILVTGPLLLVGSDSSGGDESGGEETGKDKTNLPGSGDSSWSGGGGDTYYGE